MKKGNLHCFLKLNDASKRLLRKFSRRKKGIAVARKTMVDTIVSRLTTVQGYDDIEQGYDEESPAPGFGRALVLLLARLFLPHSYSVAIPLDPVYPP